MSQTNHNSALKQAGFTLVEIMISILLIGVISTTFYTLFLSTTRQFLGLQTEGMAFGDLAIQSQRVGTVLRGLSDITQATGNDITFYCYFYPNDSVQSQVHYYKNGAGNMLYADVTPLTANPPTGTPISAQKKTYTVINSLYTVGTTPLFTYLDAGNSALTIPISDLHAIKAIQVTIAVPVKAPSNSSYDQITLQVSLRNRKSNL